MILRELFDISDNNEEEKGYDPAYDDSVKNSDDVRTTQLKLKQINRARKSSEFHQEEQRKELAFIQQMYGQTEEEEMGGI